MNSARVLIRLANPALAILAALVLVTGCRTTPRPGTASPRLGDEIIVAGVPFHTGARVVTWMDPGGYDAYRVERRFSKLDEADWDKSKAAVRDLDSPNRYNLRRHNLTDEDLERVRGGGWDLPTVRKAVDQFVLHYDVCGTSRQCFKILQDMRGLSVHFMLDIDGTIYQTLDVKERAWHATTSNSRSVGIEIANMGAYGSAKNETLANWYPKDEHGPRIKLPASFGNGGVRTKNFVGRPARPEVVSGVVQGRELFQYDFTPEQYEALARLTAALCKALPQIKCDYPRDAAGKLVPQKLPDDELGKYQGVMGHFHIQTNKTDPGPAFQWDYLISRARELMSGCAAAPLEQKGAERLIAR